MYFSIFRCRSLYESCVDLHSDIELGHHIVHPTVEEVEDSSNTDARAPAAHSIIQDGVAAHEAVSVDVLHVNESDETR